ESQHKLEGILEIYEKFVGDDPRKVPMKIFPGMHYTMGGLWVDADQHTNIPGILAAGEADYTIHGANRLGANSLVRSRRTTPCSTIKAPRTRSNSGVNSARR
ncbi:MAG: FAD-binding protein, partial [Bryocella sp.]